MKILHNHWVRAIYVKYPCFISNTLIEHKAVRLQTYINKTNYVNEKLVETYFKFHGYNLTSIGTSWKPV